MKTDATPDRLNQRTHQHYVEWFIGDGVTTEFRLQHRYLSIDGIAVYVNGNRYKPDLPGVAHDFKVRGITAGYDGEQNAIKFAAAPLAAMDICVDVVST